MVEQVLVVPRTELFGPTHNPHGFGTRNLGFYRDRIARHARFVDRPPAEEDPSLKQIIPYAMVRCGRRVLTLTRLAKQTEKRLHNKMSIGVGGHINPDGGLEGIVERGLRRELEEELHVRAEARIRPVGYINDDSSPVGSVHFGLVFEVLAATEDVSVRETELMEGGFRDAGELPALAERMESWSRFLVDHLGEIVP
ncbi:MAG: NUDIX domain-containing protein [Planctomycetia bacterium]|nr:NUDIX domain-containing protein [Planctomycetia bacterium]